ncbi:hypothetical protein BC628DRAFT_242977 [Trametes gibbosa]|nr:hypothetical protein BC628DRAFT_242977 [Trametes gibbosa]
MAMRGLRRAARLCGKSAGDRRQAPGEARAQSFRPAPSAHRPLALSGPPPHAPTRPPHVPQPAHSAREHQPETALVQLVLILRTGKAVSTTGTKISSVRSIQLSSHLVIPGGAAHPQHSRMLSARQRRGCCPSRSLSLTTGTRRRSSPPPDRPSTVLPVPIRCSAIFRSGRESLRPRLRPRSYRAHAVPAQGQCDCRPAPVSPNTRSFTALRHSREHQLATILGSDALFLSS